MVAPTNRIDQYQTEVTQGVTYKVTSHVLESSSQQVSVKGCDVAKRHSLEVRKTAVAYRTSAIDAC